MITLIIVYAAIALLILVIGSIANSRMLQEDTDHDYVKMMFNTIVMAAVWPILSPILLFDIALPVVDEFLDRNWTAELRVLTDKTKSRSLPDRTIDPLVNFEGKTGTQIDAELTAEYRAKMGWDK